MVKYEYRSDLEVFKRVDNRGPSLKFNIIEARRIESMVQLGMKVPTIMSKIDFVNSVSETNLRTFIKNLENGNIDLKGDYPPPTGLVQDMSTEARINELENKVNTLEAQMSEIKSDCFCSAFATEKKEVGRLKRWFRLKR